MRVRLRRADRMHLFKDGELDGVLRGDLEYVDAVAPPEGAEAPLLNHAL